MPTPTSPMLNDDELRRELDALMALLRQTDDDFAALIVASAPVLMSTIAALHVAARSLERLSRELPTAVDSLDITLRSKL